MAHIWLRSLPRPKVDATEVATETTRGNVDGTHAHVGDSYPPRRENQSAVQAAGIRLLCLA